MAKSEVETEVEQLLERGLVQLADGQVQEAVVTWMKVLDLDPEQPRALDYLETLEVIEPRSQLAAQDTGEGMTAEMLESGEFASPFTSQEQLDVITTGEGEGGGLSGGPLSDEEKASLMEQVGEQREQGNLGAALDICEEILKRAPGDQETEDLAQEIKQELVQFYLDDLKPLDQIPQLCADDANILELSLDPIGGFLLSQIDGNISLEELLTIMGTFEQYRVVSALHYFINSEIIELRPGA